MKHLSRPFQVAIVCLFVLFFAVGCSKPVEPLTTVEITVLDRTTNKPLADVNVILYSSHQDWIDSVSPTTTKKLTDKNGVVSFNQDADKIEGGKVYYIDASKGLLDNYASKLIDLKVSPKDGETTQIKIVVW